MHAHSVLQTRICTKRLKQSRRQLFGKAPESRVRAETMLQAALTESMFQEGKKSTRSASAGRFFIIALFIGLVCAILATQLPGTGSAGIKFIPTRLSPVNAAYVSTKTIATGTYREKAYYGNGVVGGPAIPQQGLEQAMSYYGSRRYDQFPSRYGDPRYQNYHYQDYYPGSHMSHRYQDHHYRPRGYGYGGYGYGDEMTFGSRGEPHLAAYRYRPGESEIFPMGRYGGGFRGGYNDMYGGGYYDRYRGGSYDRYGYHGRYGGHRGWQHEYR